MNSNRKKGIIFASLGAVLWGASGIAGQYLLINEQIAPEWLTFCRLLLAGVLLLSLLALQGKKIFEIWKDKEDRISILVFSVFGMMATQYGYFASIAESNAPTATVLEYINPILIIFWNCFREKRLPDRLEIGCTVFAVAGTFLVATGGDFGALAISPKALFWGLDRQFKSERELFFYVLKKVLVREDKSLDTTERAIYFEPAIAESAMLDWTLNNRDQLLCYIIRVAPRCDVFNDEMVKAVMASETFIDDLHFKELVYMPTGFQRKHHFAVGDIVQYIFYDGKNATLRTSNIAQLPSEEDSGVIMSDGYKVPERYVFL